MSELLQRFRYPLTYLLLLSLCVIGVTSQRTGDEMGLVSRAVFALAAPLQRLVTLPVDFAGEVWRSYVALVDVRRQNEHLVRRVAELESENLRYREEIVASERFQRLADFGAQHDTPMVAANVVGQDLSAWFHSVIIDEGSSVGIESGMPVITDRGVVGVIAGTTGNASKVLLLVDFQSHVDAYVERTRARGTVRGLSTDQCDFDYVLREEDVRLGDLLLTSGLGAVFPKGLVIGEVTRVERKPYGLFQSAQVQPAVDFRNLEEVFVLLDRRELPAPDAFAVGDVVPEAPGRVGAGEVSPP